MPRTMAITEAMRECIRNCQACHGVCVETIAHCLDLGGRYAAPEHVGLLQDCAVACASSANTMLRGSPRHGLFCGVCADVCEQCADECERMAAGDALMERCADVCRRCADSCRAMAEA